MSGKIKYLSIIILLLTAGLLLLCAQETDGLIRLDVPYYVQGKDSAWADTKLGNKSSVTIRTHGCALTCISMVLSYFTKKELTPPDINNWLKKNNGFTDGWDGSKYIGQIVIKWPALRMYGDGLVYTQFEWDAYPADIVLVKYYLEQKIPVIAEVEYKDAPHFVVLTGYDADGFIMNDPEFPDEHSLNSMYNVSDKWGSGPSRNIYGIRVLYPVGLQK